MGAFNVLNFAKNCTKLQILLHVSTGTYVMIISLSFEFNLEWKARILVYISRYLDI